MSNLFFDHPILNSAYECPRRHWELDPSGQLTQRVLEKRRRAEFITPIPKPKKRKIPVQQEEIVFDEGKGLSTKIAEADDIRCLVSQSVIPAPGEPSNSAHTVMSSRKNIPTAEHHSGSPSIWGARRGLTHEPA